MVFIPTPLLNGTLDDAGYSILQQNNPTANIEQSTRHDLHNFERP
jgi:hypothetical protein